MKYDETTLQQLIELHKKNCRDMAEMFCYPRPRDEEDWADYYFFYNYDDVIDIIQSVGEFRRRQIINDFFMVFKDEFYIKLDETMAYEKRFLSSLPDSLLLTLEDLSLSLFVDYHLKFWKDNGISESRINAIQKKLLEEYYILFSDCYEVFVFDTHNLSTQKEERNRIVYFSEQLISICNDKKREEDIYRLLLKYLQKYPSTYFDMEIKQFKSIPSEVMLENERLIKKYSAILEIF